MAIPYLFLDNTLKTLVKQTSGKHRFIGLQIAYKLTNQSRPGIQGIIADVKPEKYS
jgi:hypothetical protein